MTKAIIWQFSNHEVIRFKEWEQPNLEVEVQAKKLTEFSQANFSAKTINLLLISVNQQEWAKYKAEIQVILENENLARILILGATPLDYKPTARNVFLLSISPESQDLQYILQLSIQTELYHRMSSEVQQQLKENVNILDNVFELARKEAQNSHETIEALTSLLEYEKKMKDFNNTVHRAIESVTELKTQELMDLRNQIEAGQKLDVLREKELKTAQSAQNATEKILEFTQQEEMNMEKVIHAQQKIFAFSDEEIRALLKENKELKEKLGLQVEK